MNKDMTPEQVRETAKYHKLMRIDFLNKKGEFAENKKKIRRIHLVFSDNSEAILTRKQMEKLGDVKFQLADADGPSLLPTTGAEQ
ncbi:MAG: hypothetical protein Hals2KO_21800 [Halioglobus sp.]